MADRTATIEFDEYPGKSFTVRVSPVPMDAYLDINDRLAALHTGQDIRELVDKFASVALVDWEGCEGDPTPANLLKQDFNLILALGGQWTRAVAEAPLPLPVTSGAGGPSKARRASKNRKL